MEKILVSISITLAIIAFILSISNFQPVKEKIEELFNSTQVFNLFEYKEVENIELEEINPNTYKIILYTKCYQIEGYIDSSQANSILKALNRAKSERPLTHDLFVDTLKEFNIEFLMLKIEDLRNIDTSKAFIGSCIFKKGNKVLLMDCRPSDGTAIALRLNKPIYIKNSVIEKCLKEECAKKLC